MRFHYAAGFLLSATTAVVLSLYPVGEENDRGRPQHLSEGLAAEKIKLEYHEGSGILFASVRAPQASFDDSIEDERIVAHETSVREGDLYRLAGVDATSITDDAGL